MICFKENIFSSYLTKKLLFWHQMDRFGKRCVFSWKFVNGNAIIAWKVHHWYIFGKVRHREAFVHMKAHIDFTSYKKKQVKTKNEHKGQLLMMQMSLKSRNKTGEVKNEQKVNCWWCWWAKCSNDESGHIWRNAKQSSLF